MAAGVSGLTRGTITSAPSVCRDCVWWQSRGNRTASKERWMERAEDEWGEWGTIYHDDGGRLLGSLHTGRPTSSRALPIFPPGRRRTTRSS